MRSGSLVVALCLLAAATGSWASRFDQQVLRLPSEGGLTSLNNGGATLQSSSPCCDSCGICLGSKCRCADAFKACPSWCKLCSPQVLPLFTFTCLDLIDNLCDTKCNPPLSPPSPPSPPPPPSPATSPCCDHCGDCTVVIWPLKPRCRCRDLLSACPSWCQKCTSFISGIYECNDVTTDYCGKKCTV